MNVPTLYTNTHTHIRIRTHTIQGKENYKIMFTKYKRTFYKIIKNQNKMVLMIFTFYF